MTEIDADVLVVGAGIAGLTAAWRLTQAGRSVVVLEANDRVGGRLYGFDVAERAVQLGGRWTGPGQDRVKGLAAELGIAVLANTVFSDLGKERGDGPSDKMRAAVRKLDALARTVPLESPWTAPDAEALDSQTLASWLAASFGPDLAAVLGDILSGFLPKAGDVSLLHAAFYLHSNGGLAGILGLDGPAHDSEMFEGGAHRLPQRLAERLGGRVRLESPVTALIQDDEGVRAESRAGDVRARHAIVALPPTLAGRLIYEPALPPARDYLTQRMPIRGKIVVALLYDSPFWREAGKRLVETATVMLWDEGGEQSPAALSGLVSIDASRRLWLLPEEERRAAILADVAAHLGPQTLAPTAYHEIYWAAQPWSRGCNSFMTTGAWTAWGDTLRAPVGRIHWACAEVSARFVGQMDGAVGAAEAAVEAICGGPSGP
ncbi:MAG: FAD-dependent oxidoreductase [Rhodospirillaceae bacterium]|jgi:monoamine oxidase|nr:FAD-dependent oxidoreductase [Rhodospirillaceae bacterium]